MTDQRQKKKKRTFNAPTVQEIIDDELTRLSLEYWAGPKEEIKEFDKAIIEDIYNEELTAGLSRIMILELSRYLELYLWPNFTDDASLTFIKSIILMVNEKFRENAPDPWVSFHSRENMFPVFFHKALALKTNPDEKLTIKEETFFVVFLTNCFQSMGDDMVRKQCLRLTYLPLWLSVNPLRVEKELINVPESVKSRWKKVVKRDKRASKKKKQIVDDAPKRFLPLMLDFFLDTLYKTTNDNQDYILYCERFVELLVDLMAQLTTRRFFHLLLADMHVITKAQHSDLYEMEEGSLFNELVEMLRFYETFEIENYTGSSMTEESMTAAHCSRISNLQKIAFRDFPEELRELALSNIGNIEDEEGLLKHLSPLSEDTLRSLCIKLCLTTTDGLENKEQYLTTLISYFEKRHSQLDVINETGLYPTEEILWDYNMVPSAVYAGERSLALPKLNLQFLTFHDYLLRNFNLFRLAATNDIRDDINDVVRRMNPRKSVGGKANTVFHGWARMGSSIDSFKVVKVKRPLLGERKPSVVRAHIELDLSPYEGKIREEWEALKLHDVLYLISISSPVEKSDKFDEKLPINQQYGIKYCRGCEVYKVLDEANNELNVTDPSTGKSATPVGHKRTFCVWLDSAQYLKDNELSNDDIYSSFNLLMRRKPKENNFKAVLATIRDLMNSEFSVPSWLHDMFLGYGDGSAADGLRISSLYYNDTFLSKKHMIDSFTDYRVNVMKGGDKGATRFQIKFPNPESSKGKIIAEEKDLESRGPYPYDIPKRNSIPFTPTQVKAISSAMQEGLTLVVGPPGTGKTDVAVQIASNLYHNFPDQRTVIITHSNQALNQIFEKIMHLDIDERHLMRLGHGQKMLETEKDFSKYGRVNYMLERRMYNLEAVQKLSSLLGVQGDIGWSCETAAHFYSLHIQPLWTEFQQLLHSSSSSSSSGGGGGGGGGGGRGKVKGRVKGKEPSSPSLISTHFPFTEFFNDAPQPLFSGTNYEEDLEKALSCYRYINQIFTEVEEARPLELLRSGLDRANYLLTKQTKIVAMTCTHAALKRHELVKMGFTYDNLLMEEAAQILEIETFIPMLLQKQRVNEACRLKRVTLIGDHNQLPPVVKNLAMQRYSHLDQSLFTRFVRLNIPRITLDAQGRCRPSLAALFNWRYNALGNLPIIQHNEEFGTSNAGFLHDYQLIDVGNYKGKGETEPNPYFYQNLGEAEYIAATYMYMRLLGYPADKISIITSYNGQKHLLRDVLRRRCGSNPLFGMPKRISTVDRFQGQQNDYILLSLVRTKTVGHIRDVRRLIVAMSRARLGLYVFCRKALFQNCYELTKVFAQLRARTDKLHLIPKEYYGSCSRLVGKEDDVNNSLIVKGLEHMQRIVVSLMSNAGTNALLDTEMINADKEEGKEKEEEEEEEEEEKEKEEEEEEKVTEINEEDDNSTDNPKRKQRDTQSDNEEEQDSPPMKKKKRGRRRKSRG